MIVDNFNLLSPLLKYDSPEDFYFLQILRRRKDNPTQKHDVTVIKSFFLYEGQLSSHSDYIKEICDKFSARAYLILNRRNARKVALRTLAKLAEYVELGNYVVAKRVYESACGQCSAEPRETKKWVLDIDEDWRLELPRIRSRVQLYAEIPTVNGLHLIVAPFRRDEYFWSMDMAGLGIGKDNPTLLYFSNESPNVIP